MTIGGGCHCGAVRFELPAAPEWVGECNCSFCRKRGALWGYYPAADVAAVAAEGQATYRWNSGAVAHHHCAACGCGTWSESPTWTETGPDFTKPRIGVNARLIDGFDAEAAPRRKIDGASFPRIERTPGG